MNKPNPIILGFGALSVGVIVGFIISSISQNQVENEVSRLTVNLERLFLLVILCAILGGVAIYVKTQ
tara:strand:+ start:169 stop:369 length:201 start_codon:yes stop_codon:yes gene_type:complete